MAVKEVAIIGCGVSGLTSIKCCLDAGLNPTCFEQQSWLGGVWNYTDETRPNFASIHKSTLTNTSKLVTCFSDFPMPKEFPNYLPGRLLQQYLEMYARNFDLEKYVQFNTEVVKLERNADYGETGKWVVSSRKLEAMNSEITTKTFDAVMICNGHYSYQIKPNIPGMERFKGIQVHSGDYRTFHPYVGKRVVIVGCSHSAGDIAVELSYHANQVYISTRSGCFVVSRLGYRGKPVDLGRSRATQLIPEQIKLKLFYGLLNDKYDFKNFGLHPTGTLGVDRFVIVNDELPQRIITGSIIVKGDIKEVAEDSVILEGGETLNNVDVLVFATGFKPSYPFAKDLIKLKDGAYSSLHKQMFLPDDPWHTLAVIGEVGSNGPLLPLVEMQARVAAEVFAGRCSLPCKADMEKEIAEREHTLLKSGRSKYHFIRVDFLTYLDDLAEKIGVKPNLWSLFKEDPKLAYHCFFATAVPAHYRLQGPNSARKAAKKQIMSLQEQYICPLSTRECPPSTKGNNYHGLLIFLLVMVFAVVVVILN